MQLVDASMARSAERHERLVGLLADRVAVVPMMNDELEGLRRSAAMVPPSTTRTSPSCSRRTTSSWSNATSWCRRCAG